MKNLKSLLILSSMGLSLIACGDNSNLSTTKYPKPNSYYDLEECRSLNHHGVGIRGNSACPYKGDYDEQRGYQKYSISHSSQLDFNLGLGYRIDFGWDNDWETICNVPGQIPVFVNGRFNHCDMANPSYADPDDGTNTSACAGSQYNPRLTRCTPYGIKPIGDDEVRYIH